MKILVVDDEPLIAMDISETLKESGDHEVMLAGSTTKALEHLQQGTFDVAVLDMNLRGETSELVADACAGLGIPFLILSGYNKQQVSRIFPNAPILAKPCNPSALLRAVQSLVDKPSIDESVPAAKSSYQD